MDEELTYKIWQVMITVFVAGSVAFAIENHQPLVALVVLAIGISLFWMLKARHRSIVLVDERIKRIGEKAASITLWTFFVATAFIMFIELTLESIGIVIQQLKEITEPLSYIALGIMVIYAIFQKYYSRKM